mgnify:CR=1 FL=1
MQFGKLREQQNRAGQGRAEKDSCHATRVNGGIVGHRREGQPEKTTTLGVT